MFQFVRIYDIIAKTVQTRFFSKKGGRELEKPENKGSLAVQVILGILLLAAVALLVLLTFVDRPKGKGTLEPENISVSGETQRQERIRRP